VTVTYSDASSLAGASTNLGSDTVTVTANIYDHSAGSLTNTTLVLSNAIVGFNSAIATNIALTNAEGYRVALQTLSSSTNGNLSVTDVTNLVAGSSSNLGFTLSTNQGIGAFTNTVTVVSADDSTLNGAATNATNSVTVTGAIYGHAEGALDTNAVTLMYVHTGFTNALTTQIGVTNSNDFVVNLQTFSTSTNGNLTASDVSGLLAGSSTNLVLSLATNQSVGAFTNTVNVVFGDDSTLSGAVTNLSTNTVTVSGLVYSGQSYWITNGNGNWTNFGSWNVPGGTPGLDGALSLNDTATFDTNGSGTVTLNTNATLSALTFSNATAPYLITGSGTVTLQSAGLLNNLAGSNTIATTLNLATNVTLTAGSNSILSIAGNVTGNGGFTQNGTGTTILAGSNTYAG
jgi:hypothetical protein